MRYRKLTIIHRIQPDFELDKRCNINTNVVFSNLVMQSLLIDVFELKRKDNRYFMIYIASGHQSLGIFETTTNFLRQINPFMSLTKRI